MSSKGGFPIYVGGFLLSDKFLPGILLTPSPQGPDRSGTWRNPIIFQVPAVEFSGGVSKPCLFMGQTSLPNQPWCKHPTLSIWRGVKHVKGENLIQICWVQNE